MEPETAENEAVNGGSGQTPAGNEPENAVTTQTPAVKREPQLNTFIYKAYLFNVTDRTFNYIASDGPSEGSQIKTAYLKGIKGSSEMLKECDSYLKMSKFSRAILSGYRIKKGDAEYAPLV
jgi:hypothetical protein